MSTCSGGCIEQVAGVFLTWSHRKVPAVVNASGALSETVGEDVTVEISVKYNMVPIKIINRKDPLCTLLPQIGLSCPVEAGPITFQGEVKLPDRFMPPVSYCSSFYPLCFGVSIQTW